ncbi:MAG: flagellar type III secretion system protein FlhB [Pseudomonadota bacterium]
MSSDDESKDHEASQRKLDQAREKGEIPRSTDLMTAASYAGFLIAGMGLGASALQQAGQAGMVLLDQSGPLSRQIASGSAGAVGGALGQMVAPLWPFLLFPAVAVVAVITVTKGWLFTPANLAFRASRISPVAVAGQKFGRTGLFEFGKSFAKLCIVSALLGLFLINRADDILATQQLDPAGGTGVLLRLIVQFLTLILGISVVIGGGDYLWQWAEHARRNRMSRQELVDEAKESDGDPHQKAARRARAQEIATNRMLSDVATADVVLVNPTHYAVALKWTRADRHAPVCVAKGVDEIAARIRERAAQGGVPVHSDPPTARAVYASVEVGQEIRPEHYRAVAAAIRFSEAMRKRMRRPL